MYGWDFHDNHLILLFFLEYYLLLECIYGNLVYFNFSFAYFDDDDDDDDIYIYIYIYKKESSFVFDEMMKCYKLYINII